MTSHRDKPKVVLFHPRTQEQSFLTRQQQPLNLLSISGLPVQHGYEVIIIDAAVMEDYRQRVLKECRDALCFGATSTIGYQAYHSFIMAKEVKEKFPSLPIIAGGWFPSVEPEMIIEQGGADIVVIGQGEFTFMELLEALLSGDSIAGIKGIVYRDGNEIIHASPREIADMNMIPPMPYNLINFEDYFESDPENYTRQLLYSATGKDFSTTRIRVLYYFSSYGCPDDCAFCTQPALSRRKWTAIDAGRIVDELDHLVRCHQFNVLYFNDANWGVSEKRVFEFCEGVLKKKIKIYWTAMMEARVFNKFDKEVVDLIARSGCFHLGFGAETAFPETMKLIQKNIRPGDALRCSERCVEHGICPTFNYIVGYPAESEESIEATIQESFEIVYRWLQAEAKVRLFVPLPGTLLTSRAVKMGYRPETSLEYLAGFKASGDENMFTEAQPRLYSSMSRRQLNAIAPIDRYYFWWGSKRLRERRRLNILEKLLHMTSRFRLKHKLIGFPIEYRVYEILRALYHRVTSL